MQGEREREERKEREREREKREREREKKRKERESESERTREERERETGEREREREREEREETRGARHPPTTTTFRPSTDPTLHRWYSPFLAPRTKHITTPPTFQSVTWHSWQRRSDPSQIRRRLDVLKYHHFQRSKRPRPSLLRSEPAPGAGRARRPSVCESAKRRRRFSKVRMPSNPC